nr:TolC family protein [Flavobacterium notoginsengisoli]
MLSQAEELSDHNLKAITEIYLISLDKFNNGLISEMVLNTASINKEKAEKSLNTARQNKIHQINSLQLLLNCTQSITISDNYREDMSFISGDSFAPDPNVKLLSVAVLASTNELQSKKAAFAPSLSAFYQYNSLTSGDQFANFDNTNTFPQQYFGVRLSVPVFTGNTRRFQIQKAKLDLENRQEQYDNAVLEESIGNRNLLLSYDTALTAFNHSESILEKYQSNDQHAAQQYAEGLMALDQRLEFYSDMIISQNEFLQSMSEYFIQQYRLKINQTDLMK